MQCCRFSRNIAKVALKIIIFYYQKIHFKDQSIPKKTDLILKTTSLEPWSRSAIHIVQREAPIEVRFATKKNSQMYRLGQPRNRLLVLSTNTHIG